MAYMNQEKKKALAPQINAVLKKYGVKGTISVNNHSSLVVTLREGVLDFICQANADNKAVAERTGRPFYEVKDNYQANPYYAAEGGNKKINSFFKELIAAMKGDMWYDNSDIMTDYFDTAYYLGINIGKCNKPYVLTK